MIYTVAPGDTLSGLARRYLGRESRWPEIAAASRVHDPDLIIVGQALEIPIEGEHAGASESLQAASVGPEGAPLVFRLPAGWYVSSGYGMREFPGYPLHMHSGHDLAGFPGGTPIILGVPVTVYLSGYNDGGYGYYVVAQSSGGSRWLFGHLAVPAAPVGSVLSEGQSLALAGTTGASTGVHIHLEQWATGADWQRLDPSDRYRVETT